MAPDPTSASAARRSKRVSAQHTLERVRNNQRRHRARQKEYIASLEKKLGETEQTVSALREQVRVLQTELDSCRQASGAGCRDDQHHWSQEGLDPTSYATNEGTDNNKVPCPSVHQRDQCVAEPPTRLRGSGCSVKVTGATPVFTPEAANHQITEDPGAFSSVATRYGHWEPVPPYNPNSFPAPLPTMDTPDQATYSLDLIREGPHPTPTGQYLRSEMEVYYAATAVGESTMLCSEAYALVAQQNFKGFSQEDVETWLWTGFRKSFRPGEGCRVKTDLLFTLLSFIGDA